MLTELVSRSLGITESEANSIIDEQANIGADLLKRGELEYDDVVFLMADMGIEPDNMEEFLMRMMY